jgi:branched-chain amino acid transport system ATP-binding protein
VREGTVLAVRGLTAGYGGSPIIQGVDLRVEYGTITALVGPNGAGKSTLLKTVAGIVRPSRGHVHLHGEEVTGWRPEQLVRKGLGYMPQAANVFEPLTVHENLKMGGYTRPSRVSERIEALLGLFSDLKPALRRPAGTLSGGQRSMLALARALMADPSVLLLDEPCAGLSPASELEVWRHIDKVRHTGVAVVVVGQNTRGTLAHAHWAYIMAQGRPRREGPGRELLHDQELIDLYIGRLV